MFFCVFGCDPVFLGTPILFPPFMPNHNTRNNNHIFYVAQNIKLNTLTTLRNMGWSLVGTLGGILKYTQHTKTFGFQ